MRGVGDEALAGVEGGLHRAQLAAGERPAERDGDERHAGQREQVLLAELGERGVGSGVGQGAVQVPAHQPVGDAEQQRDEDEEDAAVEGGQADAKSRNHTR